MFTKFWKLHGEKIISISKGAALAASGAAATYALEQFSALDFGQYGPFVAAGLAVLVNTLRKFGVPVVSKLVK